MVRQTAFVFTKPHANVPKVCDLIKTSFGQVGIEVLSEGRISGSTIDNHKLIDQHYYSIASKATINTGASIPVPPDRFMEFFGGGSNCPT